MGIEIYSKSDCSFCEKAKQLLRVHNKEYFEYKLGEDFTRDIIMSKFPEAKSYPIVVVDGMHIGGYDQLLRQLTEETNNNQKLLLETQ